MAKIKLKVPQFIKSFIPNDKRIALRVLEDEFFWYLSGRPDPPIYLFKRRLIRTMARTYGIRIFIETGTFGGDTVQFLRKKFDKLYSIELEPELAARAQQRFLAYPNIQILAGDSSQVLPRLLSDITEPVLFWLDGHYSGDGTAKGFIETPILQELQTIFNHACKQHIIMIDDARCFDGTADYPTIAALRKFVTSESNYEHFSVYRDMIIIR